MKRLWTISIVALIAILGLSACSLTRQQPGAGDLVVLNLGVEGVPLDQLLADPDRARELLGGFEGIDLFSEDGRAKLRKQLPLIERGDVKQGQVPQELSGLGGYSTFVLANAFVFPDVKVRVKGLIGDFLFDKKDGSGHLTVDMRTEFFATPASYKKEIPDRVLTYQWHIDVKEGGYDVIERKGDPNDPNDPNFPDDPFPNTVTFPSFGTDPSDPRSIWARDLKYKLFAQGETIVVRDIYRQIDDGPIERLPDTFPWYKSTRESCIDLMTRDFPPAFRIDFPEQSAYCLGRCAHPAVINTGM